MPSLYCLEVHIGTIVVICGIYKMMYISLIDLKAKDPELFSLLLVRFQKCY